MFDTGSAGMYSLLWILILMAAFNIGSRKLRAQLVKPGEEPSKTVKDVSAVRCEVRIQFKVHLT